MYAVTSTPEERRTRAIFRRAEFGLRGVRVFTWVHTPRRCGDPFNAGTTDFVDLVFRPLRTSCSMVGNASPYISPSTREGSLLVHLHDLAPDTKHGAQRRHEGFYSIRRVRHEAKYGLSSEIIHSEKNKRGLLWTYCLAQ